MDNFEIRCKDHDYFKRYIYFFEIEWIKRCLEKLIEQANENKTDQNQLF